MPPDLLTPQDIIDDFLSVVDGKEWIQYEVVNDDGTATSTIDIGDENNRRCLPMGTTTDQWIDENLIASTDVIIWHVLVIDLPDIVPKSGDRIVDKNGQRWEVRSHKLLAWRTRYRFICIKV